MLEEIQNPSGISEHWKALSTGAKTGIIAGVLSLIGVGLAIMAFCCVTQRRVGRKEHERLLAAEEKEASELQEYKKQMQGGRFAMGSHQRV